MCYFHAVDASVSLHKFLVNSLEAVKTRSIRQNPRLNVTTDGASSLSWLLLRSVPFDHSNRRHRKMLMKNINLKTAIMFIFNLKKQE